MNTASRFVLIFLALFRVSALEASIETVSVVNAVDGRPIAGALVTAEGRVEAADGQGRLTLPAPATWVAARAPGYLRTHVQDASPIARNETIRLTPFRPKALYLSFYGIGDKALRESALKLIATTELNALVIDVKGDRGRIPYRSAVALAADSGAQKVITVRDMPTLIAQLHAGGVYLIARVVAFKDDPLARTHPEWAVRDRNGQIYVDREGLAWIDPFRGEVRDYVLDVAEEAARLGFDEIQFDYLRFPDAPGLVFAELPTQTNRVATISGFLSEARRRLAPYNVFVAADIFGYVLWNRDDTAIGQRLEDLVKYLDYVSPMLYPSNFQFGIPGYRNPVAVPGEIVRLSLRNAVKRTGLPPIRFRPWLQAFRDYAFDRRLFGADMIRAQIEAAEAFGSDGWMLWNPRNAYGEAGLRAKTQQ